MDAAAHQHDLAPPPPPSPPPPGGQFGISGVYDLMFTASPACTTLPNELKTRIEALERLVKGTQTAGHESAQ